MLNAPSDHPGALVPDKEAPEHFGVPEKITRRWWSPAQVLEGLFQRHGRFVARHPWIVICLCFLLAFISSFGLMAFRWENNIVRLWNPTTSETGQNFAWLWKNHPPDLRRHTFILEAENVLEPQVLLKLFQIRQELYEAVTPGNHSWSDVCLKVPLVPSIYSSFIGGGEEEDSGSNPFGDSDNDSDFFNDDHDGLEQNSRSPQRHEDYYCSLYNSLDDICFEDSILELFAQEGKVTLDDIANLTRDQILKVVNDKSRKSGLFSIRKDFESLLGKKVYDENGKIVAAGAFKVNLYGKMNVTEAHLEKIKKDSALGDQLSLEQIDDKTREVEDIFIELLVNYRDKFQSPNSSYTLEFIVAKSFPDAVNERITGDIPKVVGSFIIMFAYVGIALGKFSWVDNMTVLAKAGLASVLLALITSYGLCSALGFFVSPLHNFIPFLLLGLGVDDMFVIVQAWNRLGERQPLTSKAQIPDQLSKTMRNSGVAVTITSVTDFLAFAVGGTTTVPALRSFCMFCGLGILTVYFYQITWFTAWLVIDQRRKLDNRNAFFPCIKHKKHDDDSSRLEMKISKMSCKRFDLIGKYSDFLAKTPTRIVVFLTTVLVLAASFYGNYSLEKEFDPWLFLDPDSYVVQFRDSHDKYFPTGGEHVLLFFVGDVNREALETMDSVTNKVKNNMTDIILSMDSWYVDFKEEYPTKDLFQDDLSVIRDNIAYFLFTPSGVKFQTLFNFAGNLKCGQALPKVQVSIMELVHYKIRSSSVGIKAMNRVKNLLRSSNFPGRAFPFSPLYSVWEIDEIIQQELYRNVGLATFAITMATFCLLSDIRSSLFVILCVFLTLANVSGIMYFWGLRLDTVSCTVLIVCIGISVDFSVHVVHSFVHAGDNHHSKSDRVKEALQAIAPAVLNGGFSTLLAVVLLMFSDVYVFITFFKIFVLVVFFGLYNGLVFLPVLLGLIGHKTGNACSDDIDEKEHNANNKSAKTFDTKKSDLHPDASACQEMVELQRKPSLDEI